MSSIIQISDFSAGRNRVPANSYQTAGVQQYLDEVEREYLLKLLGQELYTLFLADLDVNGVPQTARFQAIYNEFYKEFYCEFFDSKGMKDMLVGLAFFYVSRDRFNRLTTVGVSRVEGSNSDNVKKQGFDLYTRYNNAGETFESIRMLICDDSETYPEYNGRKFEFIVNL